jgi:hypothetical protein
MTDYLSSDLDFPIKISTSFGFNEDSTKIVEKYQITLKAERWEEKEDGTPFKAEEILLYEVQLKNLTISSSNILNLTYQSDTGLLFLSYGNSNGKLLNLLNLEDTGKKIVDFFQCNKFLVPGCFS